MTSGDSDTASDSDTELNNGDIGSILASLAGVLIAVLTIPVLRKEFARACGTLSASLWGQWEESSNE
jgi:hypothetical protein